MTVKFSRGLWSGGEASCFGWLVGWLVGVLALLGLSCSVWDLQPSLWHAERLLVACKRLVVACGI